MREYGRVATRFWTDPAVLRLSGEAKLAALYCLTGPQSNLIGCYRLTPAHLVADAVCPYDSAEAVLAELEACGFIDRDQETGLIRLRAWFRYNPITNASMGKGAIRAVMQCQPSPLLAAVVADLAKFGQYMPTGWRDQCPQACSQTSGDASTHGCTHGCHQPCPHGSGHTETETETERKRGGTLGCQSTAAPPADAPVPPPDACGEGGEACHGPAKKRPRTPAEPPGPLEVPATAAQLETLAAMAAERGTTLAREASAAGLPAPIRKRDVTGLRQRLEALPRLKPDQPAGGRAVLWSDIRQLLDANEPGQVVELLRELPEGTVRGELWRKVERHGLERLPRGVDPQAVLDAAGVESVREDLPKVWAVIQAIRAGDRSMLPAEWPDTPEGEQARLLAPKIAWHIENHGNGNRPELRDRLSRLGRTGDHLGVLAMAREMGLQLEGVTG